MVMKAKHPSGTEYLHVVSTDVIVGYCLTPVISASWRCPKKG